MIKDYSKNACPVIELHDLQRAILRLPNRLKVNQDTKSDTYVVTFDGDEEKFIMFDWDDKANQWRLRNKIVFKVNDGIKWYFCSVCSKESSAKGIFKDTEHIINKDVTKKKCKICGTITNIYNEVE
jgi:hypothetical protein